MNSLISKLFSKGELKGELVNFFLLGDHLEGSFQGVTVLDDESGREREKER